MNNNQLNSHADQLERMTSRRELAAQRRRIANSYNSLMEQQASMLESMNEEMSRDEKLNNARRLRDMHEQFDEELKMYRRNAHLNRHILGDQDFQAHLVYFRNRQNDLRGLEREARYRFEDIAEEGVNAFNEVGDSANSLLDIINALNISDISNQLGDSAQSYVELAREMAKNVSWTDEEWKKYSDSVSATVTELGNKISRNEVAEIGAYLNTNLGIDDLTEIDTYMDTLAKLKLANGTEADSIANLIETDRRKGFNSSLLEGYGDYVKALDNAGLQFDKSTMNDSLNSTIDSLSVISKGDNELLNKLVMDFTAVSAASGDNFVDAVPELINEIATTPLESLGELSTKYAGLDVYGIRKQFEEGDLTGGSNILLKQLSSMTENPALLNSMMSNFDAKTVAQLQDFDYDTYISKLDSANALQLDSKGSMNNFIKDMSIGIGKEVLNAFNNSTIGKTLSDTLSSMDMDFTDIALGISAMGSVKTLLSGLFTKLFPSAAAAGASATVGAAGATAAGASAGAAGATTLGSKLLGIGAKGASVLSKAAPFLSVAAMGIDGVLGFMKSEEWQTSKFSSVLGGMLGGTGPGVTDEGSVVSKGLNVGGGALKGAGVGAALGSVIPGLGTAVGAGVGAVVGGIGSAIGGSNISKSFDWLGGKVKEIFTPLEVSANELESKLPDSKSLLESNKYLYDTVGDAIDRGYNNLSKKVTKKSMYNGVSGFGFSIPDGSHADGLKYVPFDGYKAVLHKGESVLTDSEATLWNSLVNNLGNIVTNKFTPTTTSSEIKDAMRVSSGEVVDNSDGTRQVVDTLKWMVQRLEVKLDEVVKTNKASVTVNTGERRERSVRSEVAFKF